MSARYRFLLFVFGAGMVAASGVWAQSTLGSLSGVVRDPSGALVPNAKIVAHREESNTERIVTSGADGTYNVIDLDPGTYDLHVSAAGFSPEDDTGIHLDTRQQLHFDIALSLRGTETVTVNASEAGTINTTDNAIAAALSSEAVLDLPANYRGAGSTSPLNVIQTLPGVQPDSGTFPPQPSASPNPAVKFSIQGGLPSQSETTVDGISAQNQTSNNILGDAFPSAEAINEIRVDGVGNNAEYGQPGEITTVTKSGANKFHGSAYEYFQNSGFDAIPFGYTQASKPKKVANDFGASFSGPVRLGKLYDGRDRTFFFGDYEGLRYATSSGVQYLVPTTLEKQGNFQQEEAFSGGTLTSPFPGTVYTNNQLTLNASSAALLGLFPDPNYNVGQSVAQVQTDSIPYNYIATKNNSINSDQYDIRIDQQVGSKGSAFGRYTNKSISQVLPENLALPNGSSFADYHIFAAAFTYAFTPRLANEVRFGFTLEQDGQSNPFNGQAFSAAAKLNGVNSAFFNGVPFLGFPDLTSGGERLNASERSRLFQYVDNLTYTRGPHTFRFGGDVRTLTAYTPLSFAPADNYGNFYFDGRYTGNEFADFLAGVPYLSQVDNVTADNNGVAQAYAVYVQDVWKATPNLTLSFGARYELHPAFHSTNGQIGNFDPSVAKSGRLIYPDGYANLLSVPELQGFNACATAGIAGLNGTTVNGAPCTPVVSNSQAGLPSGLRTTPRQRVEPRIGFAYRPFGNDKTAIRGGAGYFNITTSGALFYALTGTLTSNLQSFYNTPGVPSYRFPNVGTAATLAGAPALGTGVFYAAVDTNWHDPYSLQTSLSVDQDLGHNFGLRVSYIGMQTWHLVWQPELNQLFPSTTLAAGQQPRSVFPFPNFQAIYDRATSATSNYNSGQVEVHRLFTHGLSFDSSYTFAKLLSDNQGTYGAANPTGAQSFPDEQGGYDATDAHNRHLDYGNVTGTRRNRWITNSVYELPVGRGKAFGSNMPRALDLVAGGWQVSGILAVQSGEALTPYISGSNTDPSGTGSGTLYYRQQRPDQIAKANFGGQSRNGWFNKNAFQCPGGVGINQTTGARVTGYASLLQVNQVTPCVVGGYDSTSGNYVAPIGRYGTESIGSVYGPGLVSFSTGLSKAFAITESLRFRLEGTFTNVLNHTNLADPNLDVTSPSFGVISAGRGSDFAGKRTGQVSGRLEF